MIANNAVHVVTSAASVHVLRAATGESIWVRRLPAPAASKPTVAAGVVMLNVGQGDRYGAGAEMLGLDAATGEQHWDSPMGFTGTAAADQHGRVFVSDRLGRLRAFDARTGLSIWSTDLAKLEGNYRDPTRGHIFTINTPVSPTGDRVVVHLSTRVCYCLDARDGSVAWRTAYGSYYNADSTAALLDGIVYLGTGDGGLVALSAETGEIRYEGRPEWEALHAGVGWPDPGERSPVIDSPMVVAGGAVWFGARNGFLCSYRPGQGVRLEGNLAARWGAPFPTPSGRRVLALWPRGQVAAFEAGHADPIWRDHLRRTTTGLAATDSMFVYGHGRTILAQDARQGPRRRR